MEGGRWKAPKVLIPPAPNKHTVVVSFRFAQGSRCFGTRRLGRFKPDPDSVGEKGPASGGSKSGYVVGACYNAKPYSTVSGAWSLNFSSL